MSVDSYKRAAARHALGLVEPRMRLGLGTGSTASIFVELLGERVREGLSVLCVPTSEDTRIKAAKLGIPLSTLDETGLARDTRVIYTSDHGDNLGARGLWGKSTMYEESAGVPLIMAGADVPSGVVCREPVSLVDCFPTILEAAGVPAHPDDRDLPGHSLFDLARGIAPRRTVLCEYHAAGGATGAFMIRHGPFKFVHYVGTRPMLFDLDRDPQERNDLATDPGYAGLIRDCLAELRQIVDPEAVDRRARADQEARIAEFGGREAILARGSFGYSPIPGEKAQYG